MISTLLSSTLELKMGKMKIVFTLYNIIMICILLFVIAAFLFCSCCSLTFSDMISLVVNRIIFMVTDSDEVKIDIEKLKEKGCACDSPWYSPCVIWGSKSAKEEVCNVEGGCLNKQGDKIEIQESDKKTGKDCSDNCETVDSSYQCGKCLNESPPNLHDPTFTRGGNSVQFD